MTDNAIAWAWLPELKLTKWCQFQFHQCKNLSSSASEEHSTSQAHDHKQSASHSLIRELPSAKLQKSTAHGGLVAQLHFKDELSSPMRAEPLWALIDHGSIRNDPTPRATHHGLYQLMPHRLYQNQQCQHMFCKFPHPANLPKHCKHIEPSSPFLVSYRCLSVASPGAGNTLSTLLLRQSHTVPSGPKLEKGD